MKTVGIYTVRVRTTTQWGRDCFDAVVGANSTREARRVGVEALVEEIGIDKKTITRTDVDLDSVVPCA